MLNQIKWQFSCHQIWWCKVLLIFTEYLPSSEYDQDKSCIIAFIFYGTKKKKNKQEQRSYN